MLQVNNSIAPGRNYHWILAPQARERTEKMGGGMEVNKNRWIEEWSSARENLELNFRWTRRNLALVGIFGLAVPVLVYKGIVREFHMQDEDAGRPYRKFWLS
ncbi:neuronal acetylcholine receptor subunit alpha-5 [Striga asiatica]|uniref:Neuronal acetylcholine receptor subunit alpha-5 n=1 Tax=Striga asiatica TaxID=4170 RepID=A0A5A7PBL6_STRAF|nr:neuronal acetylcholine receptor subunit alpha-5 [Striga asiatica]